MINFDSAFICNKDDLYKEIENIRNGKTNSLLDNKIIWFLDEINQIDGVFTLYSCWGHEEHYPYIIINLNDYWRDIFMNKISLNIKNKYNQCKISNSFINLFYIKNKLNKRENVGHVFFIKNYDKNINDEKSYCFYSFILNLFEKEINKNEKIYCY